MKRPSTKIPHHQTTVHSGTARFHRPEDGIREEALAEIVRIGFGWNSLVSLGEKSFIDYIGIYDDMAVAGIEFISRNYSYDQLMSWGGVWLKTKTWETAKAFANAPLSTIWLGVFFFYDLKDGLYYQEARRIESKDTEMNDGRRASPSDTKEPGIDITNLKLWEKWT